MRRTEGDRGAGMIGSLGGVLAFLALMFLAVQLLTNLYATSVVTSAAHEGARIAAGRGVDHSSAIAVARARSRGEQRARHLMGRFGHRVHMDWSGSTTDTVVLRVRADAPRFLLGDLGRHHIDRTVRARVEELR